MDKQEETIAVMLGMNLGYTNLMTVLTKVKEETGVEYFSIDNIQEAIDKLLAGSTDVLEGKSE